MTEWVVKNGCGELVMTFRSPAHGDHIHPRPKEKAVVTFIQLTPKDADYGRTIWVNVGQIVTISDFDTGARVATTNGAFQVEETVIEVVSLIHDTGTDQTPWYSS